MEEVFGFYGGKNRRLFSKKCTFCGEVFYIPKHFYDRQKFCSIDCRGSSLRTAVTVTCGWCAESIQKPLSRIKASKSGLFFCDRECKEFAQADPDPKFDSIRPDHYFTASGEHSYRKKVTLDECSLCGYNRYTEVLVVHHVDCERTNNDLTNLQVLCPTCHAEVHFTNKTGYWSKRT